jgi:hypothetical protein
VPWEGRAAGPLAQPSQGREDKDPPLRIWPQPGFSLVSPHPWTHTNPTPSMQGLEAHSNPKNHMAEEQADTLRGRYSQLWLREQAYSLRGRYSQLWVGQKTSAISCWAHLRADKLALKDPTGQMPKIQRPAHLVLDHRQMNLESSHLTVQPQAERTVPSGQL